MREDNESPGIVRVITVTMTLVVGVALLGGVGAAAFGGSLSDLGSGYGGLWGLPSMLLTFTALVLGVAATIAIMRKLRPEDGRGRLAVLVLGGAWVVAVGYAIVAHIIDPCVNGWWDTSSRIGSQPLCERFGPELNWHTRFHLLAHAVPAAFLLALYLWAMRRWGAGATAQPGPSRSHQLPAMSTKTATRP